MIVQGARCNVQGAGTLPFIIAVLTLCLPRAALAQSVAPGGTVQFAAGVRWTGAMSAGRSDANETAPGGSRFALFAAESTLTPAAGLEASLSVHLQPSIEAGVSVSIATSNLRTRISSDVEGIPDVEAKEGITQLALEGVLVIHLRNWRAGERAMPFVSAGGGYLRHLHEGRTVVENGITGHVGFGLDYILSAAGRGAVKATGLRADVRGGLRKGGAAFDDGLHVSPAAGVSFFARF